jgi:DNA repair protein RadA/Sms
VTLEGRRPLLTEVQALVAHSEIPTPRRATSGLDSARVAMIIAVLARRARAPIGNQDVYLSTVGGVRLTEPASDLAVAMAMASAIRDEPMPEHTVAFGELGLAGELRPVSGIPRRLAEAARLGYRTAYVPAGVLGSGPVPEGLVVHECPDIATAVVTALPVSAG